jgi:bifunctional DNA-binding transcriptional regulator/antitoxin component of YhaV-PrlF toxin-antitoxin module
MIYTTLSVQKTGMITLPKKWRDKNPSTQMVAEERPDGLLIKPLLDMEYWEDERGNFGVHFPMGIRAGELADRMEEGLKSMKKKSSRSRRG